MVKKIISLVLIFSTILTLLTPVYAYDNPDVSPEALRVSEEYAKAYPNGVFEFVSLQYDVEEDADEFDVIIARRGGTEGKVEVDFRVIEVTAKYEEDFSILMPTWYGYEILKKEVNTPTLLELSLQKNKESIVAVTTSSSITTSSAIEEIKATVPVYKSSLHEMRDKATGKVTEEQTIRNSGVNIFDIEDPEAIKVGDALNTLLPGASGHLVFEDGENYKIFKVKINDDELFEGPEQFTIGLYEPTGGAVLGDSFNTVVNIYNNDAGEGHIIGFDSEEYYVYAGENEAVLKIVRSGDTNTYAKIELSTLSGTAKADEHYKPIITEVMFLPGETNKKVVIPIFDHDTSETISFKMAITEDNEPVKGINRTKVYIYPGSEKQQTIPLRKNISLMAAPARIDPWIYVYGDEFLYEGSIAKSGTSQWNTNCFEPIGHARQMPLRDGWYRHSSMIKWLDLRGISYINWNWSNSGDTGNNNSSKVTLNGQSYIINGRFDNNEGHAGSGGISFDKKNDSWIRFENETWWNNYGNLRVDQVGLQRQQFNIVIEQGDQLLYNIWDDIDFIKKDAGINKSVYFSPGTANADIKDPYRDETVNLFPNYTDEGKLRGAELVGYQIKMANGFYSGVKEGTTIKLTPEFIEKYIYNSGGTPNSTTLTIKPVFKRFLSSKILGIKIYDNSKGDIKIGDIQYNNITYTTSGDMLVGDELKVYVNPKVGFAVKEIAVYRNGSSQPEKVQASSITNIVLSQKTVIEPIFEDTRKDIYIKWEQSLVDGDEGYADNIYKGMIFHDKPELMPSEEKSILTTNLLPQPVRVNYPDDKTFNEAMSEYVQSLNNNSLQIENNYNKFREIYKGTYNIERIIEGDIVTLYAKPKEGYTVQWWPDYEFTGSGISDKEMQMMQPSYGSSFSFEVTSNLKGVRYYFSSVSEARYPVANGKLIRPKSTIKQVNYKEIDTRNPETFDVVPDVEVSVAVADGNNSIAIGNKTYRTTVKTDQNGNFKIYLPYSAPIRKHSIKLMLGSRFIPKYVLPSATENSIPFFLEIPFMDSYYKVEGMYITDENLKTEINEKGEITQYFQVPIKNKSSVITVKTSKNEQYSVYGVRVRSYDSLGNLWNSWDLTTSDKENWSITIPNMVEAFKDGGRITVELYDSGMVGKGEIESGYKLVEPLPAGFVNLPDIPNELRSNGISLEPFDTIEPRVDLGEVRNLTPQERKGSCGTFSIAVGTGEIIKQLIEDNVQDLDSATAYEKLNILTQYIQGGQFSKNLLNKDFKPNNSGNVQSGRGKGNVTINFDIGFYIQLTKAKKENKDVLLFDYTIIYIAAELKARQDFNATIYGMPVYLTLTGGGATRGLIMAEGSTTKGIDLAYGYLPVGEGLYEEIPFYGQMHFNLYVGIGAGVGIRSIMSAGVSGKLDFDLGYQPWEAAKGVLTFALSVDIDLLVIPISFKVYEHTWELFTKGNYNDNAWLPTPTGQNSMLRLANAIAEEEGVASVGKLKRTTSSAWNQIPSNQGVKPIESIILQNDVYKHPEPEIVDLNGEKKILFYINDDPKRGEYDRTAIYYSIYDYSETEKRSLWNEPELLQDDGTGDYDLNVKIVGDKLAVIWSSHKDKFDGNNDISLEELLSKNEIYMQLFDMDGEKYGETEQLTFDNGLYSNSLPEITFDETTKNMMLIYKKTDYLTEGVAFDENQAEKIGDFLNNSYSTIAYRIYDGGTEQWQDEYNDDEISYIEYEEANGEGKLYGQRFIDFNMSDLLPVKVSEYAVASHKDKILITYVLDVDRDITTKDDTDLFVIVYDSITGKFTKPIRITDDSNPDINPKEIEFGDSIYLFWNNDGYISYIDLDSIMEYGLNEELIGGETYYHIDESYNFFTNVMEEQNYGAAESFSLTTGKDGSLYVVWNEYELTLTENTSSTDNAVKSRHMYIAMYDAKYNMLGTGENSEPVYEGAWGNKWKLTELPGENNNEQSVAVDEDGIVTVVNRKYSLVDESVNNSKYTKESDFSSLIVRTYAPTTSLAIEDEDIKIYPEYPKSGERVKLTVNAQNYGFKPSEHVTFKFEIYDDVLDNYKQLGEAEEIHTHLSSGTNISESTYFTMPEDISNVKIRITAWEENLENNKEEYVYTIKTDDYLEILDLNAFYYSEDSIRLQASILNSGNVDAENVKLIIESFNDEEYMRDFMKQVKTKPPVLIKTVDIKDENNKFKMSDIYTLDELIDVDPSYINEDGDILLRVKLVKTKNNKTIEAYKENIYIDEPYSDIVTEIYEIVINERIDIRMKTGETKNINAKISPYGASKAYILRYSSLTPDIAEIGSSSGDIYAKKPGDAEILVEAISSGNSLFLDGDGILYDAAGNIAEFDENGAVITNEQQEIVKASKSVFINVTGKGTEDEDNDDNEKRNDRKSKKDISKDKASVVIVIDDSTLNKESVITALSELEKATQTEKKLQIVTSNNSVALEMEAAELINRSNVITEISLNGGSLIINQGALSKIISGSQGNIEISFIKAETDEGRPVVDIKITSDNADITDFGGNEIIVSIPYILKPGEHENAIVVYYVDNNGIYHMVTNGQYNNGMVTFRTNHLSKFEVGYNQVNFEDVTGWAEDYITYLAARKVINGVGNNKFLPQENITRAEFVKMLAVLSSDVISKESVSHYTDVSYNDWYAPYISWAAKNGYVLGMSETIFAPNENITREQMAVIIHRFTVDRNIKLYFSEEYKLFDDAFEISTYARDSVNALSSASIISGKGNNKFEPKKNATRAESSKMLTMLLQQSLN